MAGGFDGRQGCGNKWEFGVGVLLLPCADGGGLYAASASAWMTNEMETRVSKGCSGRGERLRLIERNS